MTEITEDLKWLTVDPGEDTGWALWQGYRLLDCGQEKLWPFGDAVFEALFGMELDPAGWDLTASDLGKQFEGLGLIVCEDFRIYPWEARKGSLNWDQVRTARLIGSLTQSARSGRIPFVLQGAKIKERSEAAGAKELFVRPLDENRHANDAIRHGVYFISLSRGADPISVDEMYPENREES